jgi:hypothetical protein
MESSSAQHTNPNSVDNSDITRVKSLIDQHNLLDLLLKAICKDDENSFQQSDKIAHIYDSIKLIRGEAAKTYTLIVETFYLNNQNQTGTINLNHLFELLNLIATKSVEDFGNDNKNDAENLLHKLLDIVFALFTGFNNDQLTFNIENKMKLVDLVKHILFKYKFDLIELSIKLARILGLLAIKLRNTQLNEGKQVISVYF